MVGRSENWSCPEPGRKTLDDVLFRTSLTWMFGAADTLDTRERTRTNKIGIFRQDIQ